MAFFHPSNIIIDPEKDNAPAIPVRKASSVRNAPIIPLRKASSVRNAPIMPVRKASSVRAERTSNVQSSPIVDLEEPPVPVQEEICEQSATVVQKMPRESSLAQREERALKAEEMMQEGTGQPYKVPDLLNHSGDDNGTLFTTGTSGWTVGTFTMGSGTWTLSGTTIGADTILRTNDIDYLKQKYGIASVFVSVLQLFFLTIILSLCGVAPFMVNPTIGPYPDALSALGAKNSYLIIEGHEMWRFLVAPLTSASVIHLLFNLVVQLEAGAFFEREWGTLHWVCIYTSSSFGSTIFSTIFNPDSVTVGSTGALIGLFGAKIGEFVMSNLFPVEGLIEKDMDDDFQVEQFRQILRTTFVLFFFSILPYVDFSGLIGGLLAGFAMSMIVFSRSIKDKEGRRQWLGAGILLIVLILGLGSVIMMKVLPHQDLADVCGYFANLYDDEYDCICSQ